jgi:hypothetical protein
MISNRFASQAAAVVLRRRVRQLLVDFDHQVPARSQLRILRGLVHKASATPFGRERDFRRIQTPADFRRLVPLNIQGDEPSDAWNPDPKSHALAALTALGIADAARTKGRSGKGGVIVSAASADVGQQLSALLPTFVRPLVHFHAGEQLLAGSELPLHSIWTAVGAVALEDPRHGQLRLLTDHRVYLEFVPLEKVGQSNPVRMTLDEVERGAAYAVVITTASGVWARLTDIAVAFERRNPPLVTRVPALPIPQPLIQQPHHRQIADTPAVRLETLVHNPWSTPVDLG